MMTAPKKTEPAPGVLEWIEPARTFESVVLSESLEAAVSELIEEWRKADRLARFGLAPRNRVLLHGPSGNGKTTLCEALAHEIRLPLGIVRYSELINAYVGVSEKAVASMFAAVNQRRCVLFADECDSIATARIQVRSSCDEGRNNIVNELLMGLDRLAPHTLVVFATNLPDALDPALRRRVNLTLELPAPQPHELRRVVERLLEWNRLLPLADFDAARCGATSYAQCEQLALDHARRAILAMPDEPTQGRRRSDWLRAQLAGWEGSDARTTHDSPAAVSRVLPSA
jgi:SpoVK/Ycf46/Vps4 family AAA+-type ATPase